MISHVQKLAEAKCPKCRCDCNNLSDQAECQVSYCTEQCPTCHGTGALVPGLRRECKPGRVLGLIPEAEQMGVLVRAAKHFSLFENTDGTWTAHIVTDLWDSIICLEDTPEEALAHAICQSLDIT